MATRTEQEIMEYVAGATGDWLFDYIQYARRLTDAPLAFHIGGGLVALAGAVGANLYWYGGGAREQWPNLYVLLIGPSGTRKSTSVDIPTSVLDAAISGRLLDREFSPEKFIRNLADQPTSILKESEFSSLLERMKSGYMGGMKQRFTDLYDCHASYDRVIQGVSGQGERISINRPALSIVAASTLDWLVDSLTENDMRSGFMPRFLIFSATQKESEPPGGYFAERAEDVSKRLTDILRNISQMPRVKLNFREVRSRLVSWTTERTELYVQNNGSDEMGGLYNRLGHHVAKICALLTAAERPIRNERDAFVTAECAERAIALLDWILSGTDRLFEERVTFSKFELQAQKALRFIGNEIDMPRLLSRMRCPSSEFDSIIRTLTDRGDIRVENRNIDGTPCRMIIRKLPALIALPTTPKIITPFLTEETGAG